MQLITGFSVRPPTTVPQGFLWERKAMMRSPMDAEHGEIHFVEGV